MLTIDLFEQVSRPVTVCFGRMNPPTLGHGQLLKTVADNAANGDYYIFATKTHKLPDNPLPYDVKFKFLQAMFPEYADHMVYNPELKTIMQVAQWLYGKGYTDLNFVAGSDRIPEFEKLLKTYNGKGQPGDKGYYVFTNINMISAGDRDPDAEGLSGISASKARAAAAAGNFEDFVAKTGAGKLARPLYDAVREAMGVNEDIAADSESTTSPIHGGNIEEEAAGVGVVATNKKMARDPRYSMSITKDVKPSTTKNMLRAFRLSESKQAESASIPMIKKFLPIAKKELKLDKLPKIRIQRHVEVHDGQATFGRFVNGEDTIYVGIADRHPVDVLRTLAHELVHWRQFLDGRIEPGSGETGSPIENEAHAIAGVLMRHFNKKYPNAIKLDNIELQESQDYVTGQISYSQTLNPVAWIGDELKSEVRDRLLKISGEFVKYLEVPGFEVLDVVLTGSMANYNWTKFSDFDLHVVTNYSDLECEDLAETFYRAKKELWNNYHDITIGGHEVEMYVEDAGTPPVSAGVFSILDNRWIKKPEYDKPEVDKSAINAKVRDLIKQINVAIDSVDSPDDIQRIKDKLRKMRRAGLDTAGEFSVENLTYKILRNMGILNKMSDIQTREQDRKLSIPESKKKIKFLRPGELRGSYTDSQLQALGFRRGENGEWYIPYDQWEQLVASKKILEGDLIPWPKGTVKVDVSDVYDWYKLGQHISNLKGLGKHDFGKGPPQTVMAFGSEPLEHEYIKDLNKIGLKTYDIDENAEQKPKYVYRIDSEHIKDFEKSLKTYYHNKDFTISGRKDFEDSVDEIKGVYAADLLFTALYSTGSSEGDHKTKYVAIYGPGQPVVYFSNKDRDRIKNNISWLTVFDADNFFKLPSGEYFSEKPGAPVKQFKITDPFAYIKKRGWRIKFVEDLKQILKLLVKKSKTNRDLKFGAEGMGYMSMSESLGIIEGKMDELDMDLEDPEISDRQFEKIYGMTRREARELFSKTNIWDFPQVKDPDRPLHEQDVTEANNTKLKLSSTSPRAQEWIKKIYDKFPGTWQNYHVMSWGEGEAQQLAMFELVPSMSKRGAVDVKWFQAYPLRQGVGSKAMKVLQDMAREDGISLTLYPWDKGQISQAKLIKFYKSHGFKPTMKGSKNMVWEPVNEQGVTENQENSVEDLTAAFVDHYKDDLMGMFMHSKSSYLDAIGRARNISMNAAKLYKSHQTMSKEEFQESIMKHFVPHLMKHGFPKHASEGWGAAEYDFMKSLTQDVKEGVAEGLSWSALDEGLSLEDKMTIFEEYAINGLDAARNYLQKLIKQNMFDNGFESGSMAEAWSEKYKRSINCDRPKGFSQRAHCQGRKKK